MYDVAMQDDSLARKVWRISWPMIISELGDSIYSITDTYFVSRLGRSALGAVGIGSYLSWLFFVVVVLFYTGCLVYVSQSYGAKKLDRARKALGETIVYGSLVALAAAFIVYNFSPYIVAIIAGEQPEIIDLGSKYLSTRILALPLTAIAWTIDSSLRAIGATKYSMIAVLSSAMLNIVLDPIFIYGLFGAPALGVVGAALATVLSIAYMVPLEFFFIHHVGLMPKISLKPQLIYEIMNIGAPAAAERLVFSLGSNAYMAFIARCGEAALAAHQIGIRIESFIYMPGFAFSVAASALVGQRIGAGDPDGAKAIGWEAAKQATMLMGVLGVVVALTSQYLVLPFSPDPYVGWLASIYLILAGLSEPGLAILMTLGGGIRGSGNTRVPMMINVAGLYMFRVMPAALLTRYIGVFGAWAAMFVDVYLRGLIFYIIYRRYFYRLIRRVV